ncbi:MAG: adenylyl-sulfate kinase [Anaerolineaceae bacterium]|nr:adenylyl-sulfate kinase [Anaerolineaceae bacterium]
MKNKYVIPHNHTISIKERGQIKGHQSAILWFTGLSGSGKSTIANIVEASLLENFNAHTFLLDGDNIRTGLNNDLGFSLTDRKENIRRIGEVCKLFYKAGLIVITAFISPLQEDRDAVRNLLPKGLFIEIHVDCPLEMCESRDPKGLYKKARAGEINNFTGIDSLYEIPQNPEISLDTSKQPPQACAQQVIEYLLQQKIIKQMNQQNRQD